MPKNNEVQSVWGLGCSEEANKAEADKRAEDRTYTQWLLNRVQRPEENAPSTLYRALSTVRLKSRKPWRAGSCG